MRGVGARRADLGSGPGDVDVTRWRTDPSVLPMSRFWSQPAGTRVPLIRRSRSGIRTVQHTLAEIFPRASGRKVPAMRTP